MLLQTNAPEHRVQTSLKKSAFNSLQDRIYLQISLGGGGGQTHSQPSVDFELIKVLLPP